jgi:hypothetical protein
MRTAARAIALAILAEPLILAQAPPRDIPIGVVLEIREPAFFRSDSAGTPVPLEPRRDLMRKLYAGQSLRVGPGGKLRVGLTAGIREIRPSEAWVIVEPQKDLTPEQTKVAQALRRYGVPGGTRGIGSSLYSPAEGSAVRPEKLVICWNPPGRQIKMALRLETDDGQKLWSQDEVDGSAGKLDSAAARKAMIAYQGGGGQQLLVLILTAPNGNETRVTFLLLPKTTAQQLEKDLAGWDRVGSPLLRSIGRAYEFGRKRLLVEAADEYDTALSLAPESQDLISSAIEAHLRTGNLVRTAELRKRSESQ